MFRIEDDTLYITRGDTGYLYVDIEGYEPEDGDTITLTVRKNIGDAEPTLSITVPIDECIVIQPSDTKELEYGKYYFDVQIDTVNNEVFTVVEKSPFRITEEVTR